MVVYAALLLQNLINNIKTLEIMTEEDKNTEKQCDIHIVMCSLLVEMQETIDYLKESREYWIRNGENKKVIAYNACISQMEDVLGGYKNYT